MGTGTGNWTSTIQHKGFTVLSQSRTNVIISVQHYDPLVLVLFPVPVPVLFMCSVNKLWDLTVNVLSCCSTGGDFQGSSGFHKLTYGNANSHSLFKLCIYVSISWPLAIKMIITRGKMKARKQETFYMCALVIKMTGRKKHLFSWQHMFWEFVNVNILKVGVSNPRKQNSVQKQNELLYILIISHPVTMIRTIYWHPQISEETQRFITSWRALQSEETLSVSKYIVPWKLHTKIIALRVKF